MISVVIPNYNGKEHLKICYESLKNQTFKDVEIVMVDNGSGDDSVKFTKEFLPSATVLELNYNSGFAKAVNDGIKYSFNNFKSEYILLLNNDVELKKDFIEIGIKTFQRVSDAFSIAAKMLNYYDRTIIDNCGDFIKKAGSPYARGHNEKDAGQYDNEEYIFGACAGAAFYKRELFEIVGLFDEDFFAYFEDIDLSFRQQLQNLKCYYNPNAICYHKRGATTSDRLGLQTMYCEKNLIALRIKNYPAYLLFKWLPLFFMARIRRYYKFISAYPIGVFVKALKGHFWGLIELPKSIKKRFRIQRSRKISAAQVLNLFGTGKEYD